MWEPLKLLLRCFTFKGRLSRSDFFKQGAVALAVYAVFYVALEIVEVNHRTTMLALNLAISAYFILVISSLAIRRLRDAGQSPWWLLVALTPGAVVLLIALGVMSQAKVELTEPGAKVT